MSFRRLDTDRLSELATALVGQPVRVEEDDELEPDRGDRRVFGQARRKSDGFLIRLRKDLADNPHKLRFVFAHECGHVASMDLGVFDEDEEMTAVSYALAKARHVLLEHSEIEKQATAWANEHIEDVETECKRRWGRSFQRACILW